MDPAYHTPVFAWCTAFSSCFWQSVVLRLASPDIFQHQRLHKLATTPPGRDLSGDGDAATRKLTPSCASKAKQSRPPLPPQYDAERTLLIPGETKFKKILSVSESERLICSGACLHFPGGALSTRHALAAHLANLVGTHFRVRCTEDDLGCQHLETGPVTLI